MSEDEPVDVTISISPATASLLTNGQRQFTATVNGAEDTSVTWSVQEGAAGGSVDADGFYTAPGSPGVYHVVATSNADATKTATATVTVTAPPSGITVSITPDGGAIFTSGQIDFSATVSGAVNNNVLWSVVEGAAGGTINNGGTYTAPAVAGTYHVRAESVEDASAYDVVTVVVTEPTFDVTITPDFAEVETGGSIKFTGTVAGPDSPGQELTWEVVTANGGTIGGKGQYTAPITPGTYVIKATSTDNPAKSDTATITVVPANPVISITPTMANMDTEATIQVQVSVTGTVWRGFTISADGGVLNGVTTATTGFGSGNYSFQSFTTLTTYTITAVATAKPANTATASITVTAPMPYMAISPTSTTVKTGDTFQFSGSATNSVYTAGEWSVVEADAGTIDSSGLYTAPVTPGTYTVKYTSVKDSSRSATATVIVYEEVCPEDNVVYTYEDTADNELAYTRLAFAADTTYANVFKVSEFNSPSLEFNAQSVTQAVTFAGAGMDGIWRTADDLVDGVFNVTYDSLGRQTGYASMATDGVSGAFVTDTTRYGEAVIFDGATSKVQEIRSYVSLGDNGVLDDDEVTGRQVFYYSNVGFITACCWGYTDYEKLTSVEHWSTGTDGIINSGDDVLLYVEYYEYDVWSQYNYGNTNLAYVRSDTAGPRDYRTYMPPYDYSGPYPRRVDFERYHTQKGWEYQGRLWLNNYSGALPESIQIQGKNKTEGYVYRTYCPN